MRWITAAVGLCVGLHAPGMGAQVGPVVIPIPVRWTVTTTDTTALLGATARWGCRRALVAPPIVAVTCDLTRAPKDSLVRVRGVEAVELDRLETLPTATDAAPSTWGLTAIKADTAWNRGLTGAGVVIGIMDSGIDRDHPALAIAGGKSFTADTSWDDNVTVCRGHGTHVAGTAGGSIYAVAPGARVYALKVFEVYNNGCASWSSAQQAALTFALANQLRIVNASIGGSWAGSAEAAARTYALGGGAYVAASGNAGAQQADCPACYFPWVIAVGALANPTTIASYSNRSPDLALTAPGSGVLSTMPGGGTGSKSGTSMASPHVAGAVALIRQRLPTASPDSIRLLLTAATVDLGTAGPDAVYGAGALDLEKLTRLLVPRAPVVADPPSCPVSQPCCAPVAGVSGPWTATTPTPDAVVWTTATSVCWRKDTPGPLTIRLRSL